MDAASVLELIDALDEALGRGDPEQALSLLARLEAADPGDPAWPKRRAEILRQRGEAAGELEALVRASELQVEAGQVMRAIATCRRILVLDPDHAATEARLQLLYEVPRDGASRASGVGTASAAAPRIDLEGAGAPASADAAIEEIVLTEVVDEVRPLPRVDPEQSGVAEIPLDPHEHTQPLDLDLDGLDPDRPPAPETLPALHAAPDETQARALEGEIFRSIGEEGVRALLSDGRILDLPPDHHVFRQGDAAEHLYVILEGAVVPVAEGLAGHRGGLRMGVLESGDFFGEIGLLTRDRRNASVRTLVETRLLAVPRPAVWRLLRRHPRALALLLRTLRVRLIDRLVRTHPLFALFGRAKRSAFARQVRMLEVREGVEVVRQGLVGQGLYVVLAGHLAVRREGPEGSTKTLAELAHGDLFGEFSTLTQQAATASVETRSKCWLLHLSDARFRKIAGRNPRLVEMLRALSSRRDPGPCRRS